MSKRNSWCLLSLFVWGTIIGHAAQPPRSDASPKRTTEVEKQCSAVVSLFSFDRDGKPATHAAGFFVSADGRIATVQHLVRDSSRIIGETQDGRSFKILGVLGVDPECDVVILKADIGNTPAAKLGSFGMLTEGMPLLVAGDQYQFHGAILTGKAVHVENTADDYRWFTLDAPIAKGHSGSPVLTESGIVVGMIWGDLSNPTRGIADSVDAIQRVLASIGANAVKRAIEGEGAGKLQPVSALSPKVYTELFNDPDFKAAMAAWDRKDNDEAVRRMKVAIKDFPDSLACQVLLGSFYSAARAWPEAEKAYERALEIQSDHADTWTYLGVVYGLEGKIEASLSALRRGTELKPTSDVAWGNLGTTCVFAKRYDEARHALIMLQGFPTNSAAEKARALQQLLTKHDGSEVSPKSK